MIVVRDLEWNVAVCCVRLLFVVGDTYHTNRPIFTIFNIVLVAAYRSLSLTTVVVCRGGGD